MMINNYYELLLQSIVSTSSIKLSEIIDDLQMIKSKNPDEYGLQLLEWVEKFNLIHKEIAERIYEVVGDFGFQFQGGNE